MAGSDTINTAARHTLVREQIRDVPFAALARYIGAQSDILSTALSSDEQLWLYALYKCATDGPICAKDEYSVLARLAAATGLLGRAGYRNYRKSCAWSAATAWIRHSIDRDGRHQSNIGMPEFSGEARVQYATLVLDKAPECWPDDRTLASLRLSGGSSSGMSTQTRSSTDVTGGTGGGEMEMVDELLAALEEDDEAAFLALCALYDLKPDTILGKDDGWADEPISLVHLVAEMTALECCRAIGSLVNDDHAVALDHRDADGLTAVQKLFRMKNDTASACAQALIDGGASH